MKNCTHCKYVEWKRREGGNLHPSGDGHCKYPIKMPKLPASMYWFVNSSICGGFINRHKELKEDCIYYREKS